MFEKVSVLLPDRQRKSSPVGAYLYSGSGTVAVMNLLSFITDNVQHAEVLVMTLKCSDVCVSVRL